MFDRLPLALQQCILVEWLSPETVWIAARACVDVLEAVGTMSTSTSSSTAASSFQASEGEILSNECVAWFQTQKVPLRLWSTIQIDEEGTTMYLTNGVLHRDDDLPASIDPDGSVGWYRWGKSHRDGDKPADMFANGARIWYQNDKLHRNGDKPAVVLADGQQEWFQHGERHRDGDEPAFLGPEGGGYKAWYKRGLRHREGGRVAVQWADGAGLWCAGGKTYIFAGPTVRLFKDVGLPADHWLKLWDAKARLEYSLDGRTTATEPRAAIAHCRRRRRR